MLCGTTAGTGSSWRCRRASLGAPTWDSRGSSIASSGRRHTSIHEHRIVTTRTWGSAQDAGPAKCSVGCPGRVRRCRRRHHMGELQPLQCAPDVRTVGELEVLDLVQHGAVLIDARVSGSGNGVTLPGARSLPHDQAVQRRGELDSSRVSIAFCNGPQCPQSPLAIRALLEAGLLADSLAYYRGGVHDWVTLAMPTEATS